MEQEFVTKYVQWGMQQFYDHVGGAAERAAAEKKLGQQAKDLLAANRQDALDELKSE